MWRRARGLTAGRADKFSIIEVRNGSHVQAAGRVYFSRVSPASIVQSSAVGRRRYRYIDKSLLEAEFGPTAPPSTNDAVKKLTDEEILRQLSAY